VRTYKDKYADYVYQLLFVPEQKARAVQNYWDKITPLKQEAFALWAKIFEFAKPPEFGEENDSGP